MGFQLEEHRAMDLLATVAENGHVGPNYGELLESPQPIVRTASDSKAGMPVLKIGESEDAPSTREIVDNANKAINNIEKGEFYDYHQMTTACSHNMGDLMRLEGRRVFLSDEEQSNMTELLERSRRAMEHSLSNAEQNGGKQLLSDLIERTNCNAWLDGSPLQLRYVDNTEGENVVELVDSTNNKVIHSIRFPKADPRRSKK